MNPDLTPGELLVLTRIADGRTHESIARELGVSRRRVTQVGTAAYVKLGARNAPHAVAIAYRTGLLGGGS